MNDRTVSSHSHVVTDTEAGQRLDALLAVLAPELGLRGRRRLVETGRATVDGQTAKPGYRPRAGQVIALAPLPATPFPPGLGVVAGNERFAALAKPAGLDSTRLAGGDHPSVEDFLPALLPGAVLVNRLDAPTSGLLLAAFTPDAAADYRRLEDEGRVTKTYLAVVHGRLDHPLTIARALDTTNRRKTAVLPADSPDPLRTTNVTPLAYDAARDLSLAAAVIHKGARHQIRAHLAAAGHPILGDRLYGPADEAVSRLYLHHRSVSLPGFVATIEPDGPGWAIHNKKR